MQNPTDATVPPLDETPVRKFSQTPEFGGLAMFDSLHRLAEPNSCRSTAGSA